MHRNNVIGCVGADVTEIAAVAGKPSHRGRRRVTRGSCTRYHNNMYTIIERISSKTVHTTSVRGARVFLYFVGIPRRWFIISKMTYWRYDIVATVCSLYIINIRVISIIEAPDRGIPSLHKHIKLTDIVINLIAYKTRFLWIFFFFTNNNNITLGGKVSPPRCPLPYHAHQGLGLLPSPRVAADTITATTTTYHRRRHRPHTASSQ